MLTTFGNLCFRRSNCANGCSTCFHRMSFHGHSPRQIFVGLSHYGARPNMAFGNLIHTLPGQATLTHTLCYSVHCTALRSMIVILQLQGEVVGGAASRYITGWEKSSRLRLTQQYIDWQDHWPQLIGWYTTTIFLTSIRQIFDGSWCYLLAIRLHCFLIFHCANFNP